jgi:hypothetical protein
MAQAMQPIQPMPLRLKAALGVFSQACSAFMDADALPRLRELLQRAQEQTPAENGRSQAWHGRNRE